jgi:hypothetical protein
MAKADVTLELQRAEAVNMIHAMTPTYDTTHPFRHRSTESLTEPILESAREPRLFEVGKFERSDEWSYYWIGANTTAPTYRLPIRIIYPSNGTRWRSAALDDAEEIKNAFYDRSAEPTNVSIRCIKEDPPEFEKHPDDDWEQMELILWVQLEVS